MKSLRTLFVALLGLAMVASTARASEESPIKLEVHGSVTATLYIQNQPFLNEQGQGLLVAAPSNFTKWGSGNQGALAGLTPTPKSDIVFSGDVRQTNLEFELSGPKILGGATPKATVALDMFGGHRQTEFGLQEPLPRMTIATAALDWGRTKLTIGQPAVQLILANLPESVAHGGFESPICYQAGCMGWRSPGVRIEHWIPMEGFKVQVAAEVSQNTWADEEAAANQLGGSLHAFSQASVGGIPMLQVRALALGGSANFRWYGYVNGVYDQVNLKGVAGSNPAGVTLTDGSVKKSVNAYAVQGGGKVFIKPVTIAGNIYYGRGTGNMLGSIVQFGDIGDLGFWVQASGYLTREVTLHLIYGADMPDKKDVQKWTGYTPGQVGGLARTNNQLYGGMLKYSEGGYSFAVEFYNLSTKFLAAAGGVIPEKTNSGYQVLASGQYKF